FSSTAGRLDFNVVSAGCLLYGSESGNPPRCSSSTPDTTSRALRCPVSRRLCRPVLARHSPVLESRFWEGSLLLQAEVFFFGHPLWVTIAPGRIQQCEPAHGMSNRVALSGFTPGFAAPRWS